MEIQLDLPVMAMDNNEGVTEKKMGRILKYFKIHVMVPMEENLLMNLFQL